MLYLLISHNQFLAAAKISDGLVVASLGLNFLIESKSQYQPTTVIEIVVLS